MQAKMVDFMGKKKKKTQTNDKVTNIKTNGNKKDAYLSKFSNHPINLG